MKLTNSTRTYLFSAMWTLMPEADGINITKDGSFVIKDKYGEVHSWHITKSRKHNTPLGIKNIIKMFKQQNPEILI